MNQLQVFNFNGRNVIESRQVAEMIERQHNDLMKTIRQYIEYLGEGNFAQSEFFIESTYINSQNKSQPCYLLTKKGCEMVANKVTGLKGTLFTAAFVTKFEEMERHINKPLTALEMLKLQTEAIQEVDQKVIKVKQDFEQFKGGMPLFNIDCDELVKAVNRIVTTALGGYQSPAYQDKSLRGRVYSDIHQQIRREFGVNSFKAIKRSELELALQIVKNYDLPTVLKAEIERTNSQIQMVL